MISSSSSCASDLQWANQNQSRKVGVLIPLLNLRLLLESRGTDMPKPCRVLRMPLF